MTPEKYWKIARYILIFFILNQLVFGFFNSTGGIIGITLTIISIVVLGIITYGFMNKQKWALYGYYIYFTLLVGSQIILSLLTFFTLSTKFSELTEGMEIRAPIGFTVIIFGVIYFLLYIAIISVGYKARTQFNHA